jgi:hypothetical protein
MKCKTAATPPLQHVSEYPKLGPAQKNTTDRRTSVLEHRKEVGHGCHCAMHTSCTQQPAPIEIPLTFMPIASFLQNIERTL